MTTSIKIDLVSDVSCPWCVIGLKLLETALQRLHGEVQANIHFQPFELNPDMPPDGRCWPIPARAGEPWMEAAGDSV